MSKSNIRNPFFFILGSLLSILFFSGITIITAQASEKSNFESSAISYTENSECQQGSGLTWTYGPMQTDIANQARLTLNLLGIDSTISAYSFGEVDSCGNFYLYAIDFSVKIDDYGIDKPETQQEISEKIYLILAEHGTPHLGKVRIKFLSNGETFTIKPGPENFLGLHGRSITNPINNHNLSSGWNKNAPWESSNNNLSQIFLPLITHSFRPVETINQKVYVIVYDPLLKNGQLLSDYLGWADHNVMTQDIIRFFQQASHETINYIVADTTVLTDGWPKKIDGFQYTEEMYLAVLRGEMPAHSPDDVNYNSIVNDPRLDICGRANRHEIDEVWIYNGPNFGFAESTLVGPGAYWYNSMPVPEPHYCNRLIPIMGPSPERPDMIGHGEGHRMESTMWHVYGSWEQNSTNHNWERFALVKHGSPDYSYSGCGNTHFPPNGTSDYNYDNPAVVKTNCDDFYNYPNLGNPELTTKSVSCTAWNCNHNGYMMYWFQHIPHYIGCGPDNVSTNWWHYFAKPALANDPASLCD